MLQLRFQWFVAMADYVRIWNWRDQRVLTPRYPCERRVSYR